VLAQVLDVVAAEEVAGTLEDTAAAGLELDAEALDEA